MLNIVNIINRRAYHLDTKKRAVLRPLVDIDELRYSFMLKRPKDRKSKQSK